MAGLFDLFPDPQSAGVYGMAAGLLQAGAPTQYPNNLGVGIGQGLITASRMQNEALEAQRRAKFIEAQTTHFSMQDRLTQTQIDQAKRLRDFLSTEGASTGTTPGVTLAGGMSLPGGAQANFRTGEFAPADTVRQNDPWMQRLQDPRWVAQAKALGIDLTSLYTHLTTPQKREGGSTYVDPASGRQQYMPRLPEGMAPTLGGGAAYVPGVISGEADRAEEIAERQARFGEPVIVTPPGGGAAEAITRSQFGARAHGLPRTGPPAPGLPPQAQGRPPVQVPPPGPGPTAPPPVPAPGPIAVQSPGQASAQKAVDEVFAKDLVQYTQGGGADAIRQLAQLGDVVTALKTPGANLTGPWIGSTPDSVLRVANPKSVAMRERVEEVVQRSLRVILGAQFTEKEGERLIARAYNPALPESENAIRVGRLLTQLTSAAQAKQSAIEHFKRNGTLSGWAGKLPTIGDFSPDKVEGKVRTYNPATGRIE